MIGCSWLTGLLNGIIDRVVENLSKLPESPWQLGAAPAEAGNILGVLAWILPISEAAMTITAFAGAALVWYTYRALMRLAQMIA